MFDPRKILRQVSIPLLHEFFRRRGELQELPWTELKARTGFSRIWSAWQQLPARARREVQVQLREVSDLADNGMRAIAEALRTHHPDRLWELKACGNRLNRALWFHLHFPDLFAQSSLFAQADGLSTGRYAVRRNTLPKRPIAVTSAVTTALGSALRDYYWSQEMRGEECRVEHYTRPDGNEYFFAYLDDWPDAPLAFADDGNLGPLPARYAFSVLFVFCPQDGSLELVAKGGQAIHFPLQQAFCRSVLGIDVEPADPLRPVYDLNMLLDPNFTFPTDPSDHVAAVRLARINVAPQNAVAGVTGGGLDFGADLGRRQSLEKIQGLLALIEAPRDQATVTEAAIEFRFLPWGVERAGRTTVNIWPPNRCDLKDKPDQVQVVIDRCFKAWGILCA